MEITLKELQQVLGEHGRRIDGQFKEIRREVREVRRQLTRVELLLGLTKAYVNGHSRRFKRIGRAALS